MKFEVSNDLKDYNANLNFSFRENHEKCLLIFSTGNNAGDNNSEITVSTTVKDFKKIYGRYKYFNNWLSGGLVILELKNVATNDKVEIISGSSNSITNICVLDI